MKLTKESDILDPLKRALIIQEIEGQENRTRKYEAYKRYQCYKDKTNHYVLNYLLRQFESNTVNEMRYALSNISFVRKVVDKLARVYSNGVERCISGDEAATEKLKKIEKLFKLNENMKTTNRFLKLQKNMDVFVKPYPHYEGNSATPKYKINLETLQPYLYDALESEYDRTEAIAVVLSDYTHPSTDLMDLDSRNSKVPPIAQPLALVKADGTDQSIANSPQDKGANQSNKKYIFWTKSYHFTTNANGDILPNEKGVKETANPLKSFNHINFAIDQDGSFWAQGGDDLIDGAILLNAAITHTTHVAITQGYGQFYMTGENLPRVIKVGVTKSILVEYKGSEQQAKPELGFLSANPQIDALRSLIEMYIALYLTTNNLSTSGVSTQLNGSQSIASGIALLLDMAESLEDVHDQRQVFIDNEVKIIKAINETLKAYGNNLADEYKDLVLPDGFEENYVVKFNDATPIMTEKEKLDVLKQRKEMGLDTRIGMIMRDDPSLNEEQAEEKLLKLIEQEIEETMLSMQARTDAGMDVNVDAEGNPIDPNAEPQVDENGDPVDPNAEEVDPNTPPPAKEPKKAPVNAKKAPKKAPVKKAPKA